MGASECSVCRGPLESGVVACCDCDSRYHRACFARTGRCPVALCGGLRIVDLSAGARKVMELERPAERGAPGTTRAGEGGTRLFLDVTTSAEEFLPLAIAVLVAGLGLWLTFRLAMGPGGSAAGLAATAVTLAAVAALILRRRFLVDAYYVADSADNALLFHSRLFGWRKVTRVAALEQLVFTRIEGHRGRYCMDGDDSPRDAVRYRIVSRKRDGRRLVLSDWEYLSGFPPPPEQLRARATRLAELAGQRLEPTHIVDRLDRDRRRDLCVIAGLLLLWAVSSLMK